MGDKARPSATALRREAKGAMYAVATSTQDEARGNRVLQVMEDRKRRRAEELHAAKHGGGGSRPLSTVALGSHRDQHGAARDVDLPVGEERRDPALQKKRDRSPSRSSRSSKSSSSSSSSSGSESESSERRHKKRRKHEKHRKREKRGRKEKKAKKHRKKERNKDKKTRRDDERPRKSKSHRHAELDRPISDGADAFPMTVMGAPLDDEPAALPLATAPLRAHVDAHAPPDAVDPDVPSKRVAGAQRPEEAEAERVAGQAVRRVFDPTLGVERLVKLSGEVVEESISCEQQRNLLHAKARHVAVSAPTAPLTQAAAAGSSTYTGRDKFPSQHPWYGMK